MNAFHYRDGWRFEREEDGSVRITLQKGAHVITTLVIDPAAWASIVAHLARLPETGGEVDSPVRAGD